MGGATELVRSAGRAALDFALPPRCPGCGVIVGGDHRFCLDCWRQLDFLGGAACSGCGLQFEIEVMAGAHCGACLANPPALAGMRAAVAYGNIARALAVRLKHGGRPGIAVTMARQMARLVEPEPNMLVAPVPLHRWRIWRRGYNQSALIGRALATELGLELALDLIERRRATPMLKGMGPAKRAKTVRGAFAVPDGQRERLRGRPVLLVDDVHTTGATANACARVLLRAGAREVRLVAWACVMRGRDDGDMGGGVDNVGGGTHFRS